MSARPRHARRLAAFLATAGAAHFAVPRFYDQMIPPQLPGSARSWTYGSGVAELAVAAAIATPPTRRAGARAAFWLFVAVFPGNVQMVLDARRAGRPTAEQAVLWARLPLQLPMLAWAARVRRTA
jgi:uncharacterized membrane protein